MNTATEIRTHHPFPFGGSHDDLDGFGNIFFKFGNHDPACCGVYFDGKLPTFAQKSFAHDLTLLDRKFTLCLPKIISSRILVIAQLILTMLPLIVIMPSDLRLMAAPAFKFIC